MRTAAILVGLSLAFMALVPLASYDVSAAPEPQLLRADGIQSTDATFFSDIVNDPQALNKVATDVSIIDGDDEDDNFWDAYPGCVLWGNAVSITEGDFGTAEVRFTLADLVGETSAYYYMRIVLFAVISQGDPPEENMAPTSITDSWSFRIGFGYIDAATGTAENLNQTYFQVNMNTGTPWQTVAVPYLWEYEENDQMDRPYTADEVNNMYCVIQMRFEPSGWGYINDYGTLPVNLGLAYCAIDATPIDYTPEVATTGGFVLRPDGDNYATGFTNYSADGYEGMYGALNDTTQHGDAEQSFINATWSKSAFVGLSFTDPPDWAQDLGYKVTLWSIIRQTAVTSGEYYTLTMSIASDGSDEAVYFPSTSYTNNTHESLYVPGGANYWTLTDLEDILANLWLGWVGSTPDGEFRVTQVAFLCTPIIPADYVPDTDEFTDDSFRGWIAAGGISTIFGFMGAIGIIAGAPLAIIFFKSGRADGTDALAMAVGIIFISLCLLLAGLANYI